MYESFIDGFEIADGWHFVALTSTMDGHKLYIDGALAHTGTPASFDPAEIAKL